MSPEILDVDLLAFESGDTSSRSAVVDGVRRSLENGFVYTAHDLSEDMLDEAYAMLGEFFSRDDEEKLRYVAEGAHGQTGYTGVLVETAADAEHADWKEMLNWAAPLPSAHPLRSRYPKSYPDPVLPRGCRTRHHRRALGFPSPDRGYPKAISTGDRRRARMWRSVLR